MLEQAEIETRVGCRFCCVRYALPEEVGGMYRYLCRACRLEGPWKDTLEEAFAAYNKGNSNQP